MQERRIPRRVSRLVIEGALMLTKRCVSIDAIVRDIFSSRRPPFAGNNVNLR